MAIHERAMDKYSHLISDNLPMENKDRFMLEAMVAVGDARPAVGAAVVKDGKVISTGRRQIIRLDDGKLQSKHAEHTALDTAVEAVGADKLEGAILYTTLEPCTARDNMPCTSQPDPCAVLIPQYGIKTVVMGIIDPDERIDGRALQILRDSGVSVEFSSSGLFPGLIALIQGEYIGQLCSHADCRDPCLDCKRYDADYGSLLERVFHSDGLTNVEDTFVLPLVSYDRFEEIKMDLKNNPDVYDELFFVYHNEVQMDPDYVEGIIELHLKYLIVSEEIKRLEDKLGIGSKTLSPGDLPLRTDDPFWDPDIDSVFDDVDYDPLDTSSLQRNLDSLRSVQASYLEVINNPVNRKYLHEESISPEMTARLLDE